MSHLCRSSLHRTYGILSLLVFCQIQSVAIFPLCHICRLISFKIYQLQEWESQADHGLPGMSLSVHTVPCQPRGLAAAGWRTSLPDLGYPHAESYKAFKSTSLESAGNCKSLGACREANRSCLKAEAPSSISLRPPQLCSCRESREEGRTFLP